MEQALLNVRPCCRHPQVASRWALLALALLDARKSLHKLCFPVARTTESVRILDSALSAWQPMLIPGQA